jgi:adenosylcobinamide-GDP ribazoletransferase
MDGRRYPADPETMKNFLAAIRFITILPAGKSKQFDAVGMVGWFPVVGLVLGCGLAAFDHAIGRIWGPTAAAVLDVIFLAALTGAFHIDGLADTADGLFSHRSRERTLAIMKDSRIGAMGVVAVMAVLALKWAGLSGIADQRTAWLILVPAYSRSAMLIGMATLEYGRPEGGTGQPFFSRKLNWRDFGWVFATILLSSAIAGGFLRINLGFFIITAGLIMYYRKRLGCVTGDMLGAMAEVNEALLFFLASAGGGR